MPKSKLYKVMIKLILYSMEYQTVNRDIERKISLVEMRISAWINGVTRKYKIKNDYVKGGLSTVSIVGYMRKNRMD